MIAVYGAVVGLRRVGLEGLDVGVAFPGGAPGPFEINLVDEIGFRLVHFKLRPETGDAVLDWEGAEGWGGRPVVVPATMEADRLHVLRIRSRPGAAGSGERFLGVELDGAMLGAAPVDAEARPTRIASSFPETSVADFSVGAADGLWRFGAPEPLRGPELGVRPGLTAVVHVRGSSARLRRSLRSASDHVAEIVVLNAHRDPAAAASAAEVGRRTKIVRVFDGPAPPPRPRADQRPPPGLIPPPTRSDSADALPRVRTANILLWGPDRVALPGAFEALLDDHDLHTRADAFALWAGGVRVFDLDGRLFADTEAGCGGWLALSRSWNGAWDFDGAGEPVPHPDYARRASWLISPDPAFAEVVPLGVRHPAERPCWGDRAEALVRGLRAGAPPAGFREIADLGPAALGELAAERPRPARAPEAAAPGARLGVFCISHKGAPDRQAAIRAGWAAELTRLGVPVYFVVGDHPARRARLLGDVLHTPARDAYEHLPRKILEAVRYAHAQGFDHLLKIDDDCVVNPATLLQRAFAAEDYCGGVLARADQFQPEWHGGKCANPQLDAAVELGGLDAWFAGGAGYALSRRAMAGILARAGEVEAEMLEDVAVARALAAEGITASPEHRILSCLHFSRLPDLGREHPPVDIVWDVPAAELAAVHATLRGHDWSRAAVEPWAATHPLAVALPQAQP